MKMTKLFHIRIAICAFYFAMGWIFASWASRIPDIKLALSLSDGDLGTVLFAIPAGQLTMMAISAYLVTRFGSRITLILSTLMYALILVMISFSHSFGVLFVSLFFFGAAANLVNIALNTQACSLEGIYGRNIMSTFHGLWSLGGLFGGVVGTFFVSTGYAIPIHYISVAFICLCLICIGAKYLIKNESSSKSEDKQSKFSLSNLDKAVVLLGLMGFGGMFCEGTVYDWSAVYFATIVQPEENLVRMGYIAGMGAMTAGRFMADHFVTRYRAITVLKACGLLITTGLLLTVIFPYLLTATLGFLLVGFGISSTIPICYSQAGKLGTLPASIAITIVSSISFIGFLIGPPLIGFISEATNLRIALGAASVFGLLIICIANIHSKN